MMKCLDFIATSCVKQGYTMWHENNSRDETQPSNTIRFRSSFVVIVIPSTIPTPDVTLQVFLSFCCCKPPWEFKNISDVKMLVLIDP